MQLTTVNMASNMQCLLALWFAIRYTKAAVTGRKPCQMHVAMNPMPGVQMVMHNSGRWKWW